MTSFKEIEVIGNLVSEELKVNKTLGDDLVGSMERVVRLLVESGYTVRFIITEEVQKELGLVTNVLEIKTGNNGGFNFTTCNTHGGLVVLYLSFAGIKTTVPVLMKDISTVIIYSGSVPIIPLSSVMASVTWGRYNALFNVPKDVEVLQKPTFNGDNIVSLSDYRK